MTFARASRNSAATSRSSATTSAAPGLSQRGITDFSWGVRGLDIEAVADAAGLDRFALYGISEGCIAAMSSPGLTRIGCRTSSSAASPRPTRARQDLTGRSRLRHQGRMGTGLEAHVGCAARATRHRPSCRPCSPGCNAKARAPTKQAAMMAANIDTATPNAPALIANITCPKLLINGREDNVAPAEDARALAASMGARYMSRAGGHVPNIEQFHIEHRAIVDFVLGHQRTGGAISARCSAGVRHAHRPLHRHRRPHGDDAASRRREGPRRPPRA